MRFDKSSDVYNKESNNAESFLSGLRSAGNTTYRLEISTDQNFNNMVFNDSSIVDSFKTVSNLNSLTDYYWRVTPKNDSVFFAASGSRKFTTNSIPVLLNSPANNSTSLHLPVKCIWYGLNNAVTYKIEISNDQNFNNVVFTDSSVTDTFKTINNLSEGTRYFWKVYAKNDSAYYAVSQTWNFTTYDLLISPANNSTGIPITVDFLWHRSARAVNYTLQISKMHL